MKKFLLILVLASLSHAEYIFHNNGGPANNHSITNLFNGYACSQVDVVNDILHDKACQISENWFSRILFDTGGNATVNYGVGNLFSPFANGLSIDWNNRELIDSGSALSGSWDTRFLIYPDGATTSIDWGGSNLVDTGGIQALQWEIRILQNAVGSVVLDWSNSELIDHLSDVTLDWDNTVLNAVGSGQTTLDWSSKQLFDSSSEIVLNWETQSLIIPGSASTALNWTTGVISLPTSTTSVGASLGTLTNAPAAGNPVGYLSVKINGTIRKIPFW